MQDLTDYYKDLHSALKDRGYTEEDIEGAAHEENFAVVLSVMLGLLMLSAAVGVLFLVTPLVDVGPLLVYTVVGVLALLYGWLAEAALKHVATHPWVVVMLTSFVPVPAVSLMAFISMYGTIITQVERGFAAVGGVGAPAIVKLFSVPINPIPAMIIMFVGTTLLTVVLMIKRKHANVLPFLLVGAVLCIGGALLFSTLASMASKIALVGFGLKIL